MNSIYLMVGLRGKFFRVGSMPWINPPAKAAKQKRGFGDRGGKAITAAMARVLEVSF